MTNAPPFRILPRTAAAAVTTAAALLAVSPTTMIGAFLLPAPRCRRCPPAMRRRRPLPSQVAILRATATASTAENNERRRRYPASTVTDPHGPAPHLEADPWPEIDIDALPESKYDETNHPVPHQPWRRGDTDGCHDPLTAPWRLEAEGVVSDAVSLVGGAVVDVTWYMAKCVVSIDERSLKNVVGYVDGPEVRIAYPDDSDASGHVWDPDYAGGGDGGGGDAYGEMYTSEDEILDYEQYDDDAEYEILKAAMPVELDESTGRELPPREPRSREERAIEVREEWESRFLDEPRVEKPDDGTFYHAVDAKALSVIGQAITAALGSDDVESKLQILSRHDLILTSPLGNPCVLDSQSEYDGAVGLDVYVETRDPWNSNRVLFGKLVDRNALDVIINQDNTGRMVTVPHSMIHQVLLPSGLARGSARIKAGFSSSSSSTGDDNDDDEYDEDGGEGGGGGDDEDDEYDGRVGDGDDDDEDGGGYADVEEEEVFE